MTNSDPIDRYFYVPLSEWIEGIPNELEVDAVGLWQIVPVGRDGFGLAGDALREFVERSIDALLCRGAVPVRASAVEGEFWFPDQTYGETKENMIKSIIAEWENSGKDPDPDGVWFALPR